MKESIRAAILGLCVGDALGVPAEFKRRHILRLNPITGMVGDGAHRQPPGTWSDDTSMTLCLLDSLAGGLRYEDIMGKFQAWLEQGSYTPYGKAFDTGRTTRKAIRRFAEGTEALACGGVEEGDNGNGSLMRILPLAFYLSAQYEGSLFDHAEAIEILHSVSALTHAHPRSKIACGLYLSVAQAFLRGDSCAGGIRAGLDRAMRFYRGAKAYQRDAAYFTRLCNEGFAKTPREDIDSNGYVVSTLEAAIWCLLAADTYRDRVLLAVNLGDDADTVAAVTGGLAGLLEGVDAIPPEWLAQIPKRAEIESLCDALAESLQR